MAITSSQALSAPVDRVITLTSATQDALAAAIDAAKKGEVTKIVLPKGATIPFTKAWATKDITGKEIIIDFNDAKIDFKTDTSLSFKGSYVWTKSAQTLGTSAGDTTLTVKGGVPSDVKVGDWLKVVSDDTTPGDRTTSRKMGEALQVKAIVGNTIIFDGALEEQNLYKTNIRVGKYAEGSLTLVEPITEGSLTKNGSHISVTSLVNPVIIEPHATENKQQMINVVDSVQTLIVDPVLSEGVGNTSKGEWTYGILSQGSKETTVIATGKYDYNMDEMRHAFDSAQQGVTNTNDLSRYGPDHDAIVKGLSVTDSIAGAIGSHSGGWGTTYEDITITNSDLAITVRGRHQTYKDIEVESAKRGIQFYNESNVYQKNGQLDSYDIDIIRGHYKVTDIAFFTSGLAGNNNVDEIRFRETYFEHSGNGWFAFLDNARGDWSFTNDTFKLTGAASTLFRISGSDTHVTIKGLTLDLSSFKGKQIVLFNIDGKSTVDIDGLKIINPKGVKIIEKQGAGTVAIDYNAPFPPLMDDDDETPTDPVVTDPDPVTTDPDPVEPAPVVGAPNVETKVVLTYDAKAATSEKYAISDTATNVQVKNFDAEKGSNKIADLLDISKIFAKLGGIFSDGNNDLQDRINATKLVARDTDGDGQADETVLTIDGVDGFSITFAGTKDPSKLGVGSEGQGASIIVGDDEPEPTPAPTPAPAPIAKNPTITYDSAHTKIETNKIDSAEAGHVTVQEFDNYVRDDVVYDRLDISSIFEKLGGKYTDGVNDLQDRINAVKLVDKNTDADKWWDETVLTIDGIDDFSVTFKNMLSQYSGHLSVGSEKTQSEIIVMKETASTSPIPLLGTADYAQTKEEAFIYDGKALGQKTTIKNFDNYSGTTKINDQLNLKALFEAVGGKYNDGKNDYADRVAALKLTYGDFDGDGKKDDAKLEVKAGAGFEVTFIDPAMATDKGFDIGNGKGAYDDIIV